MAAANDFNRLDIRAGAIKDAKAFVKTRKPACRLTIDFGDGIVEKKSSAQITELYMPEELISKQVLAAVNFPPRQIADFMPEALVLGHMAKTA